MPGRFSDEAKQKVLADVRKGVHPQIACLAAGMSRSFWYELCRRARAGDRSARQFVEEVESAEAQSEVADVDATHRAVQPIETRPVICPHCDEEFEADPEFLVAMVARFESFQKAKGLAAEVAIKKLERRHPKRWSQKVIHTVQEEHERLLDVAQRVLEPEVFELLLEEYLASGSSESEAGSGPGEQTGGGVH